jgi:hypothetical protein
MARTFGLLQRRVAVGKALVSISSGRTLRYSAILRCVASLGVSA